MRIIIVSGPPGSGKSSIAKVLPANLNSERVVHIRSDDFYRYICKGYAEPWLSQADEQNHVVIEAVMECAVRYALGGYEVVVDGVIGLPFLKTWRKAAQRGIDVRYIVLRPEMQTTILRGSRRQGAEDLRDTAVLEKMWNFFADMAEYEPHVVDTTHLNITESAKRIKALLGDGQMRLK